MINRSLPCREDPHCWKFLGHPGMHEHPTITQHGVMCNACGDRIFSNMRRDFVYCRCGRTFIDGGFDMRRIGYKIEDGMPKEITRRLINRPTAGYRTQHSGPHKKKVVS